MGCGKCECGWDEGLLLEEEEEEEEEGEEEDDALCDSSSPSASFSVVSCSSVPSCLSSSFFSLCNTEGTF